MKSGYKIFLTLFVAVFFAISVVPILEIDTKSEFSQENRKLAIFPQEFNTNFPKDFEKYLNDRLGFRNEFVRTYKKAMYYGFNVSPSSSIVVGKDGHILLKEALFDNKELNKYTYDSFLNLEDTYKKLDFHAPIFFTGVPSPYLIKKEYLPEYITLQHEQELNNPWQNLVLHNGERTLSRQFIDRHILFPYDEAIFLNNYTKIYPNLNFHWVDKSPYSDMVAAMVYEQIAEYFGENVKNNPLNLAAYGVPCEKYSDIGHIIGFRMKNSLFLCRLPDKNIKHIDFYQHYNVDNSKKLTGRYNINLYINDKPLIDKKLLLLSDSFGYGVMESLASYFKEVFHIEITILNNYDQIVPLIGEYYDFDAILMLSYNHSVVFPVALFERLKKYY